MPTLFISDLHLTPQRVHGNELFFHFMRHEVPGADALYILGDLFEYWIGDDAIDVTGYGPVIDAIRNTTRQGTPVFFLHGNRDFLIGDSFCEQTGCRLLEQETVIELYGERVLLMHGDSLCRDDTAHQEFRRLVLDPDWQQQFLSLPVDERVRLAIDARSQSKLHKSMTSMEVMDVNAAAVADVLRKHGVKTLIHGHTHRPAVHAQQLGNASARRIVLGDWYTDYSALRWERDGFSLRPGSSGTSANVLRG